MKTMHFMLLGILAGLIAMLPVTVQAHCDTMDGPVVTAAKEALEKADVTPVLKWIKQEQEPEIRAAFAKTLVVRKQSAEAKELADMYFFETLVRIHRAGEGEPYTGLKPAGTPVEPGIAAADKAIASGKVNELLKELTENMAVGVRQRYQRVMETRKHADESVAAGREYVEAYVEFAHYVERLHQSITGEVGAGAQEPQTHHH